MKIVAVPADAVCVAWTTKDVTCGLWATADGTLLGEAIWGDFAIVEQISNDPSEGAHGRLYSDPVNPGLGNL